MFYRLINNYNAGDRLIFRAGTVLKITIALGCCFGTDNKNRTFELLHSPEVSKSTIEEYIKVVE